LHPPNSVLRFNITNAAEEVTPWENEPSTLQDLLDNYIIENKIVGHTPGMMLYLTKAETRSGERINALPDQQNKLFLAPCLQ